MTYELLEKERDAFIYASNMLVGKWLYLTSCWFGRGMGHIIVLKMRYLACFLLLIIVWGV